MIAGIFFAEIVAMIVVYFRQWLPYPVATLMDATIMVILIYPVLCTASFRPLLRNIEELQQAKISLHQKEELQGRFFNSIDVMIAYMDRDFNFIKVNANSQYPPALAQRAHWPSRCSRRGCDFVR